MLPSAVPRQQRIVVVDDYQDLREALMLCLAGPQRLVAGAGCARQLDALLDTQQFDVALLDVDLPGESGLAIAARLRRQRPGMHLLLMSGRSTLALRQAGTAWQASTVVLPKPVDPDALDDWLTGLEAATAPP